MPKNILGVKRDKQYSPNSADRDTAVLLCTARRLTADYGCRVRIVEESALEATDFKDICAAFSMARSQRALDLLSQAEEKGIPVINSPEGVRQLSRRNMYAACGELNVQKPPFVTEQAAEDTVARLPYPLWLKRDDACAQQESDIHFIDDDNSRREAFEDFRRRGISKYILEKHLAGDVLKFYGVAGTKFFHCYYPTGQNGFSKFGMERINGVAQGYVFNRRQARQQVDELAGKMRVPVYGGDAIVSPEGVFHIIDFNDWPSYSSCLLEASQAIAALIAEKAKMGS